MIIFFLSFFSLRIGILCNSIRLAECHTEYDVQSAILDCWQEDEKTYFLEQLISLWKRTDSASGEASSQLVRVDSAVYSFAGRL